MIKPSLESALWYLSLASISVRPLVTQSAIYQGWFSARPISDVMIIPVCRIASVSAVKEPALLPNPKMVHLPVIVLTALVPASFFVAKDGQAQGFVTYLLFLAVFALWPQWRTIHQRFVASRLLVLAAALVAYIVVTSLWSNGLTAASFFSFAAKALLLLVFLISAHFVGLEYRKFVQISVVTVIAAATVTALVSIYAYYNLDAADYKGGRLLSVGRLRLPVVGALAYGFALTLCIVVLLSFRSLFSLLAIPSIAILGFAIYLTYSRGAWVGVITATALLLAMKLMRNVTQRRLLLLAALFVALLALGLVWLAENRFSIYYKLVPRGVDFRRLLVWQEFLVVGLENHPVFGAGALSPSGDHSHLAHGHNIFVSAYYFTGIAGVGLLFLLALQMWNSAFNLVVSHHRALGLAVVAYSLSTLMFDGGVLVTRVDHLWLLFWFPLVLVSIMTTAELTDTNGSRDSGSG